MPTQYYTIELKLRHILNRATDQTFKVDEVSLVNESYELMRHQNSWDSSVFESGQICMPREFWHVIIEGLELIATKDHGRESTVKQLRHKSAAMRLVNRLADELVRQTPTIVHEDVAEKISESRQLSLF